MLESWGMARGIVEAARSLDFRGLYYSGLIRPGEKHTWHWDDGVAVAFYTRLETDGGLTVRYAHGADPDRLAHTVRLVFVPLHYGGSRPLVVCPTCDRRRGVLYLEPERPRRFRCRGCLGLAYESTRLDPVARARRRLEHLSRRYGIPTYHLHNPERPKGMRQTTFRRVLGELLALDEVANPHRGEALRLREALRTLRVAGVR